MGRCAPAPWETLPAAACSRAQSAKVPFMISPFALRRAEFFSRLPAGAAAILGGAPEAKRNGDNHYRFRQPADLYFLTGFAEPEAMAVFTPGTPAPYTLFLRPRDPHRETWYGRRAGLLGA